MWSSRNALRLSIKVWISLYIFSPRETSLDTTQRDVVNSDILLYTAILFVMVQVRDVWWAKLSYLLHVLIVYSSPAEDWQGPLLKNHNWKLQTQLKVIKKNLLYLTWTFAWKIILTMIGPKLTLCNSPSHKIFNSGPVKCNYYYEI